MACRKRKTRNGHDGEGDMPPSEGSDELILTGTITATGGAAYLVARHREWKSPKPYSVYKLLDLADDDVAAPSDCEPAGRRPLRHVARLDTPACGKSFASVRSRHGAWIVGAGGDPGDTVIFDTATRAVIRGPSLSSAKSGPALAAVGDRVYALSRTPSWFSDPDFPPWFEVLDLSQARVVVSVAAGRRHLEGCSWAPLPHPPCFPWKLPPIGYTLLPVVILVSYAVVGAYILVSFNQTWGTHALDTGSHEWHKVDDDALPFVGRATQHGSIFLAASKKDNGWWHINAYDIRVAASGKNNALKLSVAVLPVKYEGHEVAAAPCLASLDNGRRFCSLSLSLDGSRPSLSFHAEHEKWFPWKAHVNLTTYRTDENPSLLEGETHVAAKPEVVISSKREEDFKIYSSSHGFSPVDFTLLSI